MCYLQIHYAHKFNYKFVPRYLSDFIEHSSASIYKPTNIMINNRPNGKSSYGLFIWNCRYFGGRVGLSDIIRGHPRLPQFSL